MGVLGLTPSPPSPFPFIGAQAESMPQLDQFTYLTQFVWLCVCFLSFNVLLYHEGLPTISRMLKVRQRMADRRHDAGPGVVRRTGEEWVIQCVNTGVSSLYSCASRAWEMAGPSAGSPGRPRTNRAYVTYLGDMGAFSVIDRAIPPVTPHRAPGDGRGTTAMNHIFELVARRPVRAGGWGAAAIRARR